ncbi:MAG: DUF2341 domain-containing protein [Planctomycetia bacterium]|nr:DUF2341 domain-containing protein [Planctomycetia bacterium]
MPAAAAADGADWKHSGSLFVLTTPEGANLPASAAEEGYPLLVRLHKDFFDFSQAQAHGEDIRFFTTDGTPLAYQIDEWDAARGVASIWVRLPKIQGNARQELRLRWGRPDAKSESNGAAVFNESNGYLGVWHMNSPVRDDAGTLETKDTGTTAAEGMIGPARHLAGGQGLFGGEKIANYPTGAASHSSEAWFRPERPNSTILAWGNEQGQGKVVMHYRSPPHVSMDCYFSGGNVEGASTVPIAQWVHVMHTYQKGEARIYVNGVLDGTAKAAGPPLNIRSPAKLWIGGWYNNYDFVGDIDEVRISKVTRSADWAKLQFENQKPQQTLVGPVVQPGGEFSVSPAEATVQEGKSVALNAQAGGAQKIYWTLKDGDRETLLATDRFHLTFDAGRVAHDKTVTLQLKAVNANEVKTKDIAITIKEDIPEPVFTLSAPATWDGRSTIEIVPRLANLKELQAKGVADFSTTWSIADFAVTREVAPDKLILTRAHHSGKLLVTATLNNGGQPTTQTAEIVVTQPEHDAWIGATPGKDEQPRENQFYARDDKNEGTLVYNGTFNEAANEAESKAADSVFLRLYAGEELVKEAVSRLAADKSYAFSFKLKPGLIKYKVLFGAKTGDREKVLRTVGNLVCGDAYLIDGQSNAEAVAWGNEDYPYTNEWIRTFGSANGGSGEARLKQWGNAVARGPGGKLQVGYWGLELARRLMEKHKMPICVINGAVGGTRIDQHQRNPADPTDVATIYGRLLWRVQQACLTHGIRGVLWHQGENDQGSDGPTGGYGWENYRQFFIDMAADWKRDYPNIQHYYVFQIWPKSCSMGIRGSDNRLREVQRTLPTAFSRLSVMSTLGVQPPGECHYPPAGYAEIARLICPLVERDNYGQQFTASITPPNLVRAHYANEQRDEVALEFDQPVRWDNALASQFYFDGAKGLATSGSVQGNILTLKLAAATGAKRVTYLDSKEWSPRNLLRGENGIAALTFCEVPILPSKP